MPFIDLNNQTNISQYNDFDYTIIGAGAAGILLAVKLSMKGKKVILIESGHFNVDEDKQQLNEVNSSNKILETAKYGRFRAIGGTTLRWGGGSSQFSKLDFEKREWVQNCGWPISYSEVAAYYNEVDDFMKIDKRLNTLNINDPGFNPPIINYSICKWAAQPNFFKLYKKYLKKNVIVIFNALLLKIIYDKNSNVEDIVVSNFKCLSFNIKTKCLILATGSIECNRILLANQNSITDNQPNYLGKMFMEHPSICVGTIRSKESWRLQKIFNTHFYKGAKYSIRLNLSDDIQKKQKVLNCTASVMMENAIDEDPYLEIKNLKNNFSIKGIKKIIKFLPSLLKTFYSFTIHNFIFKPNAIASLMLMAEQEPIVESSVSLAKETDKFGIPKAKVNWEISPLSWKTIVLLSEMLKEEIERLGLGEVTLNKEIKYDNTNWYELVSDVNHHMGGVRMSTTAEKGVVDTNLKVWGVNNLYVCSAAVFPTGSHSNPTVTMLALGLRLVNFLTNNLRKNQNIINDNSRY